MLTVHLLGHAHITQNGQPVPLSTKAVALIAYLAAEKLPQHRERLADLLWNTAEARTNLRVELARIRSAGLNIFPASRQLLYLESITTDIDQWQAQHDQEMNQTELSTWLSTLRGLPLCGLEDLGSTAFQVWVEQQRWMISEKVESTLARVYAHYAHNRQEWATRLISSRAEAVGFNDPSESVSELIGEAPLMRPASGQHAPSQHSNGAAGAAQKTASAVTSANSAAAATQVQATQLQAGRGPAAAGQPAELHFERLHEEQHLHRLLSATEPQSVLLHGPPGSGKSYLAERLIERIPADWDVLRLTAARSGRLLVAALAQALLKPAGSEQAQILRQVLLQPGAIEEDMVKVAMVYSQITRPLVLVLDEVHAAPTELIGLLELMSQMSSEHLRLNLLLSREAPDRQPVTRTLLRRLPATEALALPPVTLGSVQRVLMSRYPQEAPGRLQPLASRLTQRSEGNPLHLLSLLASLPDAAHLGHADLLGVDLGSTSLPQAVRDTLRSEPEGWSDALREAMSRLSVINGAFDRLVAQSVLNLERETEVDTLLCDALERQILLEVDTGVALQLPDFSPVRLVPEVDTRYMFRNEALRVTLAGQLPQLVRQDVRRRLVTALSGEEPGLASYYAERSGLPELAKSLWGQYQDRLPKDSPLRDREQRAAAPAPTVVAAAVAEPARLALPVQGGASHQGYTASLEGGWLSVMSDGRYGHPQTLTLRLNWPAALTEGLRLVWRLDVFSGGEELRPSQSPFPLHLRPIRSLALQGAGREARAESDEQTAFVFTPRQIAPYSEDGLKCLPQPGVIPGHWMEHRLDSQDWLGATGVEISVRALDVALTIGVIEAVRPEAGPASLIVQPPLPNRKIKNAVATQTG